MYGSNKQKLGAARRGNKDKAYSAALILGKPFVFNYLQTGKIG